ncbi:unnamed protein product [Linum tenue]|uniref:7-deoxyloganetin glucosyltransferase-like n=1 Tax=Linum tenue TaxID=586396 RepID=A0AAV0JV42_9ROSI|nr:unnamed protein product [Linum tenue]
MLKLAKILHHRGFHVTFVNTEFNHRRLLRSRGSAAFDGLSDRFRFETIPDGLPPSDADATQEVPALCDSTRKHCLAPFKRLLSELNEAASAAPPVSCVVSDAIMSFTLDASKEIGVPNVLLWTASACGFVGYLHYRQLLQKVIAPLKDASYLTNGYMETQVDWIPGMEGIPLKYLPSFFATTDANDLMFNFVLEQIERVRNASALIFNTFDKLEQEVLRSLFPTFPPIYTLGPLHLLKVQETGLESLQSNLWKEETDCLEWLDLKEPDSVVYVNFGSITVMTPHQLAEFAWGLASSNKNFLWVIRPDLVMGNSAILPQEFLDETKERGLLASWCPQEKVLKHPSVGGFLTHCGWNSTLESLTSGRSEIERLVGELMDGEKGKEMKKRALEWKKLAEEATEDEIGEAYLNLEEMINKVLLN